MTGSLRSALGYVAVAAAAYYALVVVPRDGDIAVMINGSIYAGYAILALSLALIWGFGGILSFGQASFFGLAGYVYAIAGINLGDTAVALFLAVAASAAFAAILGYFMFWGRLSDVYLGVITLTVSLILFRFFNQTAGEEWTIGAAPLGGFNGIPSTPILTPIGHPDQPLSPENIYILSVMALAFCYLLCRFVIATRFGRAVVAIRENPVRAELLGYDTRLYKLGVFVIGGAIAGLGGVVFANSVFVSPTMFNLQTNGQVIIWVIVGGLGTLAGPVLGCFAMLALSTWLGSLNGVASGWTDPNLVMGAVLTVCVVTLRQGLLPTVVAAGERLIATLLRRIRIQKFGQPHAVDEPL
ncbi:branched-chain amino acid ABC transporter permease [Methylobacterium sp. R2-1]|uniref:branched-chain amino acid ABC transporter permease n=1 Tax=Methylobacterium sp. R2-1 TaxID=2587064 RepID=UPI00182ED818|nr:branched-chain amino acid ABC transporter permease [Methylobacterium sp. R2-1]MBB2965022.1 branched-chain amino acid transport system permease protein [Methylobacterium sp. R2-1]